MYWRIFRKLQSKSILVNQVLCSFFFFFCIKSAGVLLVLGHLQSTCRVYVEHLQSICWCTACAVVLCSCFPATAEYHQITCRALEEYLQSTCRASAGAVHLLMLCTYFTSTAEHMQSTCRVPVVHHLQNTCRTPSKDLQSTSNSSTYALFNASHGEGGR